jgi:hypothetical protein
MHRLFALFFVAGFLGAQEVPPAMAKAASTFLAAVANDDAEKLATVTRFPIKSNEFKSIGSKAELQKAFSVIFPKARKAGLISQKPTLRTKGIYSISSKEQNDPIQFLFKQFGSEFQFYLIDNINE